MKAQYKALLLTSILALGSVCFAETENLMDENLPTQSSKINTSIELKPKLGTIWGYDFTTEKSGFKEVIDLDLEWEILGYKSYETDVSDLEYGLPYGMAMFSGGHLTLKLQNQTGDMSSTNEVANKTLYPVFSINYEKIWGKIVWDPFYLLVAANEKNFYERHTGWSFATANNKPRANWSHIGYRVQGWSSSVNSNYWAVSGVSDQIKTEGEEAGIGIGYIGSSTEVLFMTTSKAWDDTANDNMYDVGLSLESNPVGNLMVNASVVSGANYDVTPLGASAALGYRFDLTNTIAFQPHTAMDIKFSGTESDPMESYATENSLGFDIIWPGSTGWGDNPLANAETNIFAGLTVDGSVILYKDGDPAYNMAVSLHEDGVGGLIPNLGVTLVYELANLQDPEYINTYGFYAEYNIWNQFKPYTRIKKQLDTSVSEEVSGEFGLEITVIPHSVITVKYESKDISAISEEANKGLFTTAIIVTF